MNFHKLGVKLKPFLEKQDAKTGRQRTKAVAEAFLDLIATKDFSGLRPDQIWTGLNHAYIISRAEPELRKYNAGKIGTAELIEVLQSLRQGWVKSSGTAFEYFIERIFDPILQIGKPKIRLLSKKSKLLKQ